MSRIRRTWGEVSVVVIVLISAQVSPQHLVVSPRSSNDGGWPAEEIALPQQLVAGPNSSFSSGRACDLDVVDGSEVMSDLDGFVRKYILTEKPVLIKELLRHDPHLQRYGTDWAFQALMDNHGNTKWPVSDIAYPQGYFRNITPTLMRLKDFLSLNITANESDPSPKYIFAHIYNNATGEKMFCSQFAPEHPSFLSAAAMKAALRPSHLPIRIALGGPGAGAQFHKHNAAWNLLVYGKKAWAVTPPTGNTWEVQQCNGNVHCQHETCREHATSICSLRGNVLTPRQYIGEKLPRVKHMNCVQEAGDVLVIPHHWGHLTYTLKAGIMVASGVAPWSLAL